MDSYVSEKLRLAADELTGSPNRKKLEHVVTRTLVGISDSDLSGDLRTKYQEIHSLLLRHGKLGAETLGKMSDGEVRQVWTGLQELCLETVES